VKRLGPCCGCSAANLGGPRVPDLGMASRNYEAVEGEFIIVYQFGRLLLRYWDGWQCGTEKLRLRQIFKGYTFL
jgi:hypothetical protein